MRILKRQRKRLRILAMAGKRRRPQMDKRKRIVYLQMIQGCHLPKKNSKTVISYILLPDFP